MCSSDLEEEEDLYNSSDDGSDGGSSGESEMVLQDESDSDIEQQPPKKQRMGRSTGSARNAAPMAKKAAAGGSLDTLAAAAATSGKVREGGWGACGGRLLVCIWAGGLPGCICDASTTNLNIASPQPSSLYYLYRCSNSRFAGPCLALPGLARLC